MSLIAIISFHHVAMHTASEDPGTWNDSLKEVSFIANIFPGEKNAVTSWSLGELMAVVKPRF